jgi:hypothetical protein
MSNCIEYNRQLSPKENPVNDELVKDSKTGSDIKSKSILKEILHKAVTFTPASIDRDTEELNNAITCGYEIDSYVRTETGIVYILTKWNKQENSVNKNDVQSTGTENLKEYYEEFLNGETR